MAVDHRPAESSRGGESTLARVLVVLCTASLVVSIGLAWVAKTFVEGVRRVRGEVTRERIIDAMESAGSLDIGIGIPLHFSRDQHQGSHHVWLTVLRKRTLVPFEW